MSERKKCVVRDGAFVDPCPSLYACSEFGNPTGKKKGIFAWEIWEIASDEPVARYYGVKSGDHVAKGFLLNVCPFCGERIDAPFLPKGAA